MYELLIFGTGVLFGLGIAAAEYGRAIVRAHKMIRTMHKAHLLLMQNAADLEAVRKEFEKKKD